MQSVRTLSAVCMTIGRCRKARSRWQSKFTIVNRRVQLEKHLPPKLVRRLRRACGRSAIFRISTCGGATGLNVRSTAFGAEAASPPDRPARPVVPAVHRLCDGRNRIVTRNLRNGSGGHCGEAAVDNSEASPVFELAHCAARLMPTFRENSSYTGTPAHSEASR